MSITSMLVTILLVPSPGESPTVEELEKSALDARLAIKTASLKLRVKGSIERKGKTVDYESEYSVWVDSNHLRSDVVRQRGGPNIGVRTVNCENCESPGWGLRYDDGPDHVAEFKPLNTPGRPDLHDAIDARIIGYSASPFQLLRKRRLDQLLGRADRKAPKVTSEKLDGKDCWVVRFAFSPPEYKGHATLWIRPDAGNNVARIEVTEGKGADRSLWVATSELARLDGAGIWFPNKVIYEQRKGESVLQREVVEVTEATLNKPIPAKTFTLGGIGIREGKYIQLPDDKKSGYWRNGKIDTENRPVFKDTTPPSPAPLGAASGGVNYWLIGASIALAVLAIGLILTRRRSVAAL